MNKNDYPVLPYWLNVLQGQYVFPKPNTKVDFKFYFLMVFRVLSAVPFIILMFAKEIQIMIGTGKFRFDAYFLIIFMQAGHVFAIIFFGILSTKFRKLYYSIIELDRFGVAEDHNEILKKLNFISKIVYYYSQTTIFIEVLTPFIDYNSCMKRKEDAYTVCGIVNIWAPVDITEYPYKVIVILMHAHNHFTIFSSILAITFFSITLTRYLYFRLQFTRVLLHRINESLDYKSRRERLFFAIQYHQRILSNSEKILDVFTDYNILYVFQSGVVIGTAIYGSMTEFNFFYFSLGYVYFSLITTCSYTGQKIMEECENIGMVMYTELNWYEWEVDLQKHVIFFLNMCQRPIKIKSGPLGFMHYESLIMLYKSSYSFLMMMRSTKN